MENKDILRYTCIIIISFIIIVLGLFIYAYYTTDRCDGYIEFIEPLQVETHRETR